MRWEMVPFLQFSVSLYTVGIFSYVLSVFISVSVWSSVGRFFVFCFHDTRFFLVELWLFLSLTLNIFLVFS